jgi:hypothetical protein
MTIESNYNPADKPFCEFFTLYRFLVKNQGETQANLRSLQKAVAGLREQVEDFRAEQVEDNEEIKRQLQELRRNKVWLPRERA